MTTANYDIIRQAVLDQQPIAAVYKGLRRELCPHAVGLKDGAEKAMCYQSGGHSSQGLSADPAQNWRCLFVAELSDVEPIDTAWATGGNHSRPNTCIDQVDVETMG